MTKRYCGKRWQNCGTLRQWVASMVSRPRRTFHCRIAIVMRTRSGRLNPSQQPTTSPIQSPIRYLQAQWLQVSTPCTKALASPSNATGTHDALTGICDHSLLLLAPSKHRFRKLTWDVFRKCFAGGAANSTAYLDCRGNTRSSGRRHARAIRVVDEWRCQDERQPPPLAATDIQCTV